MDYVNWEYSSHSVPKENMNVMFVNVSLCKFCHVFLLLGQFFVFILCDNIMSNVSFQLVTHIVHIETW